MTDLDRYIQLRLQCVKTPEEHEEEDSLKSQLESKLAESEDKNHQIIFNFGNQIMEDLKANKICIYQNKDIEKLQQIQSQHTNLVKAIQDYITKTRERMEKDRPRASEQTTKNHHNCFLDGRLSGYLWACDELQNLLTKESKE